MPSSNAHVLNGDYHSQTLQNHIEAIESLLDEGLALPSGYASEMDLDGLLRMDAVARSEAYAKSVGAGYLSPNEARARESLPPLTPGARVIAIASAETVGDALIRRYTTFREHRRRDTDAAS